MDSFKLQTRYAQSLFVLAQENELMERVYEDMLLVKKICEESPQLKAILKNPVINTESLIFTFGVNKNFPIIF